jgi:ABC-type phosphate/phosphonate transport system substrate-binding protein
VRRAAIALAGVWLFGVAVATPAAAADPPAVRIGLPQGMFRDVPPALAEALAKPFKGLMERQAGVAGEVALFPDAAAIARKLSAGDLEVGVLHGFEYAWVRAAHPDLEPIAVAAPHGKLLHACVVVHQGNAAAGVADLKADPIAVPKGIKAHCLLYLDRLRDGLPADAAKPTPATGLSTEEVLNAVAAGDRPAALVDGGALAGYQIVQPGAAKQLKVICKSDPFPPSVVVYRRGGLDEATVSRLRAGLTSASRTPQYKPLLLLWNLQGFDAPSADYEAQLAAVAKAYPAPVLTAVPVKREK